MKWNFILKLYIDCVGIKFFFKYSELFILWNRFIVVGFFFKLIYLEMFFDFFRFNIIYNLIIKFR